MSNPLGDLISRGEGGYNSYNRGTSNGHILPANQKINFSQMTLDELQRRQALAKTDPDRIFAVGKYQMVPKTLADAVRDQRLSGTEKFTPEIQERIFADCLIVGKRPQIADYIRGIPGASLHAAQKATCQEWASVDDPDTPGKPYRRYEQMGNHSTIRAGQVAAVLDQMRDEYRVDIARGMLPKDAWRAVTGQIGAQAEERVSTHTLQPPPRSHAATHASLHSDGYDRATPQAPLQQALLQQGDNGPQVADLQRTLSRLGYRNPNGEPLVADGAYGPHTRHAVEVFQREHGLHVDGIVGQDTRSVFAAIHANPFVNRYHPHHALYEQSLQQVHAEESRRSITHGPHSEALAGALAVAAVRDGLTRIDRVELNVPGTLARAVETHSIRNEPWLNRVTDPVSTQQAIHQSLHESGEQAQQAKVQQGNTQHHPRPQEFPQPHTRGM